MGPWQNDCRIARFYKYLMSYRYTSCGTYWRMMPYVDMASGTLSPPACSLLLHAKKVRDRCLAMR